jgi:hypothetical protein
MLSKRRATNPITSILVVSDSPAGGVDPVDQAISRANSMEYIPLKTFLITASQLIHLDLASLTVRKHWST